MACVSDLITLRCDLFVILVIQVLVAYGNIVGSEILQNSFINIVLIAFEKQRLLLRYSPNSTGLAYLLFEQVWNLRFRMVKVDIGRAIEIGEWDHAELKVMRVHSFPHILMDMIQVICKLLSSQVIAVAVQEVKLLL